MIKLFLTILLILILGEVKCDDFAHSIASAISDLEKLPTIQTQQRFQNPAKHDVMLMYDTYAEQPQVKTTSGLLKGAALIESQAFYGVPYAQPPVGDKRFTRSKPLAEESALRELEVSVKERIECFQSADIWSVPPFNDYTEDCLVLNLDVPKHLDLSDPRATPGGPGLPVLVYFHGGGFIVGSGNRPNFDGRYLASATNTIVVVVNYRLGAFGFLSYDEENGEVVKGNQGFKDQQLALQWIQDNIAGFGGDKNKVTIVGQSAGAQAVMFHLISAESKPLFSRAILQSNPALFKYQTLEEAKLVTDVLKENVNCTGAGISCLRSVTPQELVRATSQLKRHYLEVNDLAGVVEPTRVILDGDEFGEDPMQVFRDGGRHGDKQVMMGTVKSEMYMKAFFPLMVPEKLFKSMIGRIFGPEIVEDVFAMYKHYGAGFPKDFNDALTHAVTDSFFKCPVRALARYAANSADGGQVYLYSFDKGPDGPTCLDSFITPNLCGIASHSTDNMYLFRTYGALNYTATAEDEVVADQMNYYWANFAASGNPSSHYVTSMGEFPEWPEYTDGVEASARRNDKGFINRIFANLATQSWSNIKMDSPVPEVQVNYRGSECDFWDGAGVYA